MARVGSSITCEASMNPRILKAAAAPALIIAMALSGAPSSAAKEYRVGAVRIDRPWMRATPPAAQTAAGYLTLTNEGGEADRLVAVTAPVAGRVEIHTTEMSDGVARMRHLSNGVELAPGKAVEMRPGGVHLMFMDLTQAISPQARIPVTLTLQRAGKITVDLVAAPIGAAKPPKEASQHGKH